MIFVTGGCGFIGSNFIRYWLENHPDQAILNIDKLTYAGNPENLKEYWRHPSYQFVQEDIVHTEAILQLLKKYQPRAIIHFAAESHVDRSILGPKDFIETNIQGTFSLLEAFREYYKNSSPEHRDKLRFLHVSTDEVYGSLGPKDPAFTETTPYAPNSPYAASKAASDHLVRAYYHTYGLPTITTNCSNNYGPYQFPEKLIPLMILQALEEKPLPIYGDGLQIRDWLFVKDHAQALALVLHKGRLGKTYNIGGEAEKTNLEVVQTICQTLDELRPRTNGSSYFALKTHVIDRPGHDRRYAMNIQKIKTELGWTPKENFSSGLRKTIQWYLDNMDWVSRVRNKSYMSWIESNYKSMDRL